FTQMLPGQVRLSVTASGFRKYEQTDVVLTATERVVLGRGPLEIGELAQTIEVHSAPANGIRRAQRPYLDVPDGKHSAQRPRLSRAGEIAARCGGYAEPECSGMEQFQQYQHQRQPYRNREFDAGWGLLAGYRVDDRAVSRAIRRCRGGNQSAADELSG